MIADLAAPNGLCFSPDEQTLYVVDSRATPHRQIWAYPVASDGRKLGRRRLHIDAGGRQKERLSDLTRLTRTAADPAL